MKKETKLERFKRWFGVAFKHFAVLHLIFHIVIIAVAFLTGTAIHLH